MQETIEKYNADVYASLWDEENVYQDGDTIQAFLDAYKPIKLEVENQKAFIQQKINFYQNDVNRYDTEIERISSNISTLSNAKASTIEVQYSTVSGGIRRTISTTELRMAQSRINIEEENPLINAFN